MREPPNGQGKLRRPHQLLGAFAGTTKGAPASNIPSGVGAGPPEYSDEIGPSTLWAGITIPAPGGGTSQKDKTGPGAQSAVYGAFPIRTLNIAPIAGGTGVALTTAGNATSGTALVNIATYAAGLAPVPIFVGGVAGTGLLLGQGLDTAVFAATPAPGIATLSTIANAWRYKVNEWLLLLNGGASGAAIFAQITAVNYTTGVISLSVTPTAGTGQLALTNAWNVNKYGSPPPTAPSLLAAAGWPKILIPEVACARGVGILGATSGVGGNVLISGADIFGAAQSEIIVATAGATTVWGKKTYSVFYSATPQFTDAHNYTVVLSDFFGFPMSVMDAGSIVAGTFAGTALIFTGGSNTGTVVQADITNPATTTTKDPRGGIQLTANGPATVPGGSLVTLNGTNVLTIDQRLNPLQVALATAINLGPLLGVPPA